MHVTRLLGVEGVDVNARDARGRSPVYVASEPAWAVVEAVVEAGGDVDSRPTTGRRPTSLGHSDALSA